MANDVSFHRAMSHLRKGGLHRALNVPENEDIPKDKIAKAANSSNPHLKKMAQMAENMSHWNK